MQISLQSSIQSLSDNPVIAVGTAAIAAAALIAAWSAFMLLKTLFYSPTLNLATPRAAQAAPSIDTGAISKRNFFGFAEAEPTIVLEQLPETELKLVLKGAFTAVSEINAGAIIQNENNQTDHYRIGETVTDNTVLKSVHSDRIVLTRNGIFETLYFPDAEGSEKSGIGATKFSNSSGTRTLISSAGAEDRRAAIRERIEKLKEQRKK